VTDIDVQLFAGGVLLDFQNVDSEAARSGPTALMFSISHPDFDHLAEQCAEAALNKRGRSGITLPAGQVQIGDYLLGMEVLSNSVGPTWCRMHLSLGSSDDLGAKWAPLELPVDQMVKAERTIS